MITHEWVDTVGVEGGGADPPAGGGGGGGGLMNRE